MSDSYSKGLIKYTSRDYDSLLEEFKNLVPKLTELWRPDADADPGMVMGKYLASVADMLGVNLDWQGNEVYAPSVSQRKNAEKVFGLIGYELGWYTAARTEVTFTNATSSDIKIDFGFNGSNFATLNAYTDITDQARNITYNILPLTNKYGATDTRSRRALVTDNLNIFAPEDRVTLAPGQSVTRVAIEGELRRYSVAVSDVKKNNYIIKLPSQHVDTTAVWVRARDPQNEYEDTQWRQVASPAEFIVPEARFAVTYDSYSNAQIQISNYLNQLDNYENDYLIIYWIDCSGVIGCVGADVLTNFLPAVNTNGYNTFDNASGDIVVSNLANTHEYPHTHAVTGKSPETAKQAYASSRNYVNTFDSLVTLPDFIRFLNREPGVDCGTVIDCQKALEINLQIYNDENLTPAQKSKMYISKYDFPEYETNFDWAKILGLGFNPSDPNKFVFSTNFQPYTAMCYAIHNDFQNSSYGQGSMKEAQMRLGNQFYRYKPAPMFVEAVKADYRPLQAMTVELEFGWVRVFPWYVVGRIFTKRPVSVDVGNNIVSIVKEKLAIYFAPANRQMGQMPTTMEVVNLVQNADSRIAYFDAGSLHNPVIVWNNCDIECFNPISFAQYIDRGDTIGDIRIDPTCLLQN